MEHKLIITADDYGMSQSVNDAIEACAAAGGITSCNVMTNMDYCEPAKASREKFPNLSVGLHWTLTAGRPVLDPGQVPTLTDEDGYFWKYPVFKAKVRRKQINTEEMRAELRAQYDKFVKLCGAPDYFNTHQNISVDPHTFFLFLEMAQKLSILKMRTHQRIYIAPKGKPTIPIHRRCLEPAKQLLLGSWMKKARRWGFFAPDGLLTPLNENNKLDLSYVFEHIKWKNWSVGELVIHPATQNDSLYFGNITDKRIKEYQLFKNPALKDLAQKAKISFCGFDAL